MKMTGRHYLNYLKLYDKNRVFITTDNYLERFIQEWEFYYLI